VGMSPTREPSPPECASLDELPGSSQALLDAVLAISSDLDLHSVLTRIVEAATTLTGSRYGALGVIGADDGLVEFVTTGLTEVERARIGDLPHGRGILGLLISDPRPIRLRDLADHPASYGFPTGHPPMGAFLGVPVRIRGTVFGNLYLTEKKDGGGFTETDERLVVALASAAGLVIENARTYGRSERQRQWLEAAAELTNGLQPPVERDLALRQIALTTRRVARARAVAIVSLDGDGAIRALAGEPGDVAGMTGAVESLLATLDRAGLAEPIDVDLGVDGLVATVVPVLAQVAESGLLVAVFDPADHRLRDVGDRELLISFADHAALALDRAQAVGERAQLAVISDRERIARDLHDVVIQRLFAIGMQLQAATLRGRPDEVRERLEQAVRDIDTTIRDVRATIFELQTRGAGSLRQELHDLVGEYVPILGFSPAVRTSGPVDTAVTGRIRDQLLPVLREALSNVARHAHASQAEVELAVDGGDVCLVVQDDGVGMHPDAAHSGLHNTRRRATALGGTLELFAREPQGSLLRWRVPLARAGSQG
jgi:signal transduction histidine kinase